MPWSLSEGDERARRWGFARRDFPAQAPVLGAPDGPFDPTADKILFEVDRRPRTQFKQGGVAQGVGNDCDAKPGPPAVPGGQADAVDGDAAFFDYADYVAVRQHEGELLALSLASPFKQSADTINMAGDEMTAESIAQGEGAFEIDALAASPARQGGRPASLGADVEGHDAADHAGHGQADPVGGDRVTELGAVAQRADIDLQDTGFMTVGGRRNGADVFDDASKHGRYDRGKFGSG